MTNKFSCLCVFLAIMFTSERVNSQNIPETLNRYLIDAAADGQINGATLIAQDGKILYHNNFGYADIDRKIPITDDTLFPLASISKNFTAIAVLQLKEQGKLSLDDPLAKYLTDFPFPTITIRQLLSHTSGLPDSDVVFDPLVAADTNRILGLDDVMPVLIDYQKKHSLSLKPGEKWSYCSLGYSLLALLVQKISQTPFDEYVQRNVFEPAHMTHSYIQTNLLQAAASNRTVNYLYNNHFEMKLQRADTLPDKREWIYNMSGLHGGGNVISSALDLFQLDQALYSNALLKPKTLAEAFTPVKLNNGENNQAVPGTSYGLGWFTDIDQSHGKLVWHSGSTPGVTTLFARNVTTHQCYVVLLNVACSMGIYQDILGIIRGTNIVYRPSLAFIYGRDLFQFGPDYAICHFNQLRDDTNHYSLKESEIDRVGLEFSRVPKLGPLAREAYKINTLLFPSSWRACDNYADILRQSDKNAAAILYKKSLSLNPVDDHARKMLEQIK